MKVKSSVLIRCTIISVLLFVMTGCASFAIQGGGNVTAKDGLRGHETVYSSCWKESSWNKRCMLKDSRANFVKVRYKTNFFYSLASVVTLGVFVPQDVEWWLEDVDAGTVKAAK
jgi:hypothetical protein